MPFTGSVAGDPSSRNCGSGSIRVTHGLPAIDFGITAMSAEWLRAGREESSVDNIRESTAATLVMVHACCGAESGGSPL